LFTSRDRPSMELESMQRHWSEQELEAYCRSPQMSYNSSRTEMQAVALGSLPH
jgi:hypothetical protein